VRRVIGDAWPALSYHFGIHPWDVERLTHVEIATYLDALADLQRKR
jgi:hypothetical protein